MEGTNRPCYKGLTGFSLAILQCKAGHQRGQNGLNVKYEVWRRAACENESGQVSRAKTAVQNTSDSKDRQAILCEEAGLAQLYGFWDSDELGNDEKVFKFT